MEFVAAEKYIKIKYGGWPERAAAMVTVTSRTVGHDQWDGATSVGLSHERSYTIVSIAPRVAAFHCSISSSSE
jgi:hypothetical protein